MTKTRAGLIATGCAVLAVTAIIGVSHAAGNYLQNQDAARMPVANTNACQTHGAAHTVTIHDAVATPPHTQGKLCDTLTIINQDDVTREMAFGLHEKHEPYDGITEKQLTQGQSLTITLNKTGTYYFHDHEHDEVAGDFTVAP